MHIAVDWDSSKGWLKRGEGDEIVVALRRLNFTALNNSGDISI